MKNTKEKSKLSRFFYKEVLNVRTIMTIITIILAIYFSLETKTKRELKYYCHPVKTTVVKAGQTSSLEVFCDKEKIESDVTAVQVAIWNHGKKSIKRDDILETITLYTEPKTPIIDAVIRKRTREVIKLSVDRSFFKEGFIPINWHILEHNDGGIIQVIFAGSPDVEILAKGIIEGQKSIKQIKYYGKVKSQKETMEYEIQSNRLYAFAFFFMGIFMIGFLIFFSKRKTSQFENLSKEELREKLKELDKRRKRRNIIEKISDSMWFHLIFISFCFVLAIYNFLKSKAGGPPFSF